MPFYLTVEKPATAEITEKRSKFIASVFPVTEESEATEIINKIKKEHWSARHNVYAYVLKTGNINRYSDDGEPSGTAGVPVLDVIVKQNITNCLVVVTRYFGGVLLGTGGLVRAYSAAAKLGINTAGIAEMRKCTEFCVSVPYADYESLKRLLKTGGASITNTEFADGIKVFYYLPDEGIEALAENINEKFCGKLLCEKQNEGFYPLKQQNEQEN